MPLSGLFTRGKDPVPTVEEVGWAAGPVWTAAESLALHRDSIPDSPARSEPLYCLRYRGPHLNKIIVGLISQSLQLHGPVIFSELRLMSQVWIVRVYRFAFESTEMKLPLFV